MLRRARAHSAGLLAVGVLMAAVLGCSAPAEAAPRYVASTATIANPERGFYHHQTGHCDDVWHPFKVATLQNYRGEEKITLVMCIFYLTKDDGTPDQHGEPNLTNPIRTAQLTQFDKQAATVRMAGAKMIVRFAYTDDCPGDDCVAAYGGFDATPNLVQTHLEQLKPYLKRNSDVIAVVQSGFVGRWGEGYFTTNFGNTGNVSQSNWAQRKAVVQKLLTILPSRMVQVRTIPMKKNMYPTGPVTSGNAYSAAPVARVGLHNDCFLRNQTDSGTYSNPPDADMHYLELDSQYVAVGGETCAVGGAGDRTDCVTAVPEMARFHYSYLNQDYHPGAIVKWETQGCRPNIERRLGYRFSLVGSQFPASVKRGSTFPAKITIRNTGWATPFNPRPVYLVLRKTAPKATFKAKLITADPRRWQAGPTAHQVAENVLIPANLPAGTYELLLSLPDPANSLTTNPDYAIRMATNNVWEPATGLNKLLKGINVTVQ
jgi:hypothetical protein